MMFTSDPQEMKVTGKLGIAFYRGKELDSAENQLLRELRKTAVHYNALSNYKDLPQKYDYVVVAKAMELGLWEGQGRVSIMGAIALGPFPHDMSTIYFNTEYAGSGYGRVTPYSDSEAIIGLYIIDRGDFSTQQLDKLELVYRYIPPPYSTGSVTAFKSGNILLAGRAAGLTDRLLGFGLIEALISGVLAARAIICEEDYDKMMKPLRYHTENMSTFRNYIEGFSNDDFGKMITVLGTPGIKQLVYNTQINLIDLFGKILSKM